jgi:peptidoglycan/LPS O-acetylase OafA/YrhL
MTPRTRVDNRAIRAAEPDWLFGGRIPSLDGWRAVAVLMVLCVQFKRYAHDSALLSGLLGKCGFVGVQVFFVISGFLITTLLLREKDRTGGISLRLFYARRMLRILPAYGLYLLILITLQNLGLTHSPVNRRQWVAALTYTVNFLPDAIPGEISHLWSLSVEEHFYLIWPVLLAACGFTVGRRLAAGCIVACLAVRWLVLLMFPGEVSRRIDLWTFTRFDDIAVGCLLAFLARSPAWRGRLEQTTSNIGRLACVAGLVLFAQVASARQLGARFLPEYLFTFVVSLTNTVTAVGFALLIWSTLIRPRAGLGRLLNHPVMCALGVLSYSVYLWHHLFAQPRDLYWCSFPQNLLFLLAAASASYFLVERPCLRLKDRFGRHQPRTTPLIADRRRGEPANRQSLREAASQSLTVPS